MLKILTIPLLVISLGACAFAGRTLEKAERTSPETDDHGLALYTGYIGLSQVEYAEGDYRDSDFFADRAIAAASNQDIEPQHIGARDLSVRVLNDAAAAQRKLTVVRYKGGPWIYPVLTAEAQLGFECWLQEMEEGRQPDDIEACRTRFDSAMNTIAELERAAMTMSMAPPPEDRPRPVDRMTFDIFFDFDSDKLTGPAQSNIGLIAIVIKEFTKPTVAVIGNADQSGETEYNLKLSQRRAETVAEALRASGVEPNGIFALGDQAPQLHTLSRARERMNRVVVISVREEP
jgi:outer membrane protein OmpA-like peptidoglycan-associated protein